MKSLIAWCPDCQRQHAYLRPQAQPVDEPRPWLPDVRDIVLAALTGFGVVAGMVWWVTR